MSLRYISCSDFSEFGGFVSGCEMGRAAVNSQNSQTARLLKSHKRTTGQQKGFLPQLFQNKCLSRFIFYRCLKLSWSENSRIPLQVVWMNFLWPHEINVYQEIVYKLIHSLIRLFDQMIIWYRWRRFILIHRVELALKHQPFLVSFHFKARWPWRFHPFGFFIRLLTFPLKPLIWINNVEIIPRSISLYCSNFK